jgi:SAM-dependent methyltransferase
MHKLKILIAIANYGLKNEPYIKRLLQEYRAMPYQIDIVVMSNIPKDFGAEVEVRVGLPDKNPWSLPFAHKQLFAERAVDYDLFIYSEDDTLIKQKNIEAFVEAQREIPPDKIAGFLRYEEDSLGNRYCCSIHSHYHWRPGSRQRFGKNFYAHFTNQHAASFILTRDQLKHCLESGGFLVPPHEGRYDLLCTAATDPYTQCGLEKVICLSRIDDFMLHHLPNQYLGKMGLPFSEMRLQIERIEQLAESNSNDALIPESTGLNTWKWEKSYYDRPDKVLQALIPDQVETILSIGCGQGNTEKELINAGKHVEAIPLDAYISVLAEDRGITCLKPSWDSLRNMPTNKKYDLISLSDILSYVESPGQILGWCRKHLNEGGGVLVHFHNADNLKTKISQDTSAYPPKLTFYNHNRAVKLLKSAGYEIHLTHFVFTERAAAWDRLSLGLCKKLLSSRIYLLARYC